MSSSVTQPFTFEDIEPYTRVEWRGRRGWVLDKGAHLLDGVDARHLLIEYDEDVDTDRSEGRIHERVVNRSLHDGGGSPKELWVDWGNRLHNDTD